MSQEKHAGSNLSFWEVTDEDTPLHPLRGNTSADVCIVGAGIAGLSIAYELSHHSQKVIVLDDGEIGRGMTARTTAHLVNALDDRYYDLEKYHGEEGAHLAAQSHSAAIDRVERIVGLEKISCNFERLVRRETTNQQRKPTGRAAFKVRNLFFFAEVKNGNLFF